MKLTDDIKDLFGVGINYAEKLKNLNVFCIKDLLWHFPFRYQDFASIKLIDELVPEFPTTIIGRIEKIKSYRTYRKKMLLTEAKIVDSSGSADLV